MSTNQYFVITKDKIEQYLSELGKLLNKKKARGFHSEIIIVGGASILLNYGFRFNSADIDCSDKGGILMNDVINEIAIKYHLPSNWINTDFVHTKSYSNKLDLYSQFYKTYGYGTLDVRTIKDEYLIAMKVVSARKYKNDYSDIYGIINECRNNNKNITYEMITTALVNLYGTTDVADKNALSFTKRIIENPSELTYLNIREKENETAVTIKNLKEDKNIKSEDIEHILSKLESCD